ncbi:MAG TPA: hypothetical protein VFO19_23555, partial [Vicinamibacterales bacterium]|nr:hypothetical protein [Vicinamibacterales bacterium]
MRRWIIVGALAIATLGSERGQTGVRPGSDEGQSGVGRGSEQGQTPWQNPQRIRRPRYARTASFAQATQNAATQDFQTNVVDYRISVRLDATSKKLEGRERLTWRNPSADTVGDLWFHLYLNAFKSEKTTFYRESGGRLRGDVMSPDKWGWIRITSMRLADGTDLTDTLTFEHPDDDNSDDETVARIVLPDSVPPGGEVTLDIAFDAQLPAVFARTGYYRDFHLAGQWFPKIAVYEPAGTRGRVSGGWNAHQFHAFSEFYANFGHFLVDITVPTPHVVGATGERRSRQDHPDGTTTYVYEQDRVHDFAWTADPSFVVVDAMFSGATDVTADDYAAAARLVGAAVERLPDVRIQLLMQPDHVPQTARHLRAIKAAIKYFGLWYGPYPYATITVVDPPEGGMGAGGMEYPTF